MMIFHVTLTKTRRRQLINHLHQTRQYAEYSCEWVEPNADRIRSSIGRRLNGGYTVRNLTNASNKKDRLILSPGFRNFILKQLRGFEILMIAINAFSAEITYSFTRKVDHVDLVERIMDLTVRFINLGRRSTSRSRPIRH